MTAPDRQRPIVPTGGTFVAVLLTLGAAASGCATDPSAATVDSREVPTGEIAARLYVQDWGTGQLHVEVALQETHDPSTVVATPFLDLRGGDRLTVVAGDEQLPATRQTNADGSLRYVAELSADPTQVRVVFDRADGSYESVAPVPAAFEVSSPTPGHTLGVGDSLTVMTSGPFNSVVAEGACIEDFLFFPMSADTTEAVLPVFETRRGHGGETCDVDLRVIYSITNHTSEGFVLAAAFDPATSLMDSAQLRSVAIQVTVE